MEPEPDELKPLWNHYMAPAQCHMLGSARRYTFDLLMSFVALVWWRFQMGLQQFPFRLLRGVRQPDQRADVASELFNTNDCCLDPLMSRKFKRNFGNAITLCHDNAFWDSLAMWAKQTRLTNMHIERLLREIKASTGASSPPLLERAMAHGVLTQWLRDHVQSGGQDLR